MPIKKWFANRNLNYLMLRLAVFMSVVGPGIITGTADNDAGGVATYLGGAGGAGGNISFGNTTNLTGFLSLTDGGGVTGFVPVSAYSLARSKSRSSGGL